MYRTNNQNIAVYPQTNNSRFLSFQLITHFYIIFVPTVLMLVYFLQYGIITAVTTGMDNVHLVFDFDISFVLAGYAVLIIYMSVLAGIISLITVLLRKFKLYAAAFFSAIVVLVLIDFSTTIVVFEFLFGFLLFEGSVLMFILKGIVFWAILLFAALLINKNTVYYKTKKSILKTEHAQTVVAIIVGIILALVIVSLIINAATAPTRNTSGSEAIVHDENAPGRNVWTGPLTKIMEFDISHLPRGSKLDIQVSGDMVLIPNSDDISGFGNHGGTLSYYFPDGTEISFPSTFMVIMPDSQLDDIQGDTLHLFYSLPFTMVNSVDIGYLMNAVFEARLDGSTLYLHYSFDKNVKAVFIPVWSFMWQFDHFKDRNLLSGSAFTSNSGGSSANVNLWIE